MSQTKIELNWFKENDDYHNFLNFKSPDKEQLKLMLGHLNTNGDVWNKEGTYYPLILSKIMKRHGQHFDDHFFFRTFVNNDNSKPATADELNQCLDILNNQHHKANYTKAHFLIGHENPYIRCMAESVVKGLWDHIDFNVSETIFTEEDRLKLEEA